MAILSTPGKEIRNNLREGPGIFQLFHIHVNDFFGSKMAIAVNLRTNGLAEMNNDLTIFI